METAPTDAAVPAPHVASGDGHKAKLTAADQKRYEQLYKKNWRTIYRWVERGEKAGDPCPLHDPRRLLHWWPKHFKWKPPQEVELAAVEAAKGISVAAPAATSPPIEGSPDPAPPKPTLPEATPPTGGQGKSIRLEDIDPEEGSRLRELKQIQVAKFNELKEAFELGQETRLLEDRYIKMSETIDKIEARAIDRAKKHGLYISREEVDRDLAKNAELLRQMRESMERRVLELCPSLTADQRIEVSAAVLRARQREDVMLAQLDCLTGEDLLRELAVA